ncbi:hypothetical protein PPERSA_11264 [Pseudocohnilembus persalinus]|uniref:HOOK N-terminal domain-containing protein n=1 Tax=Pseudocohnilembus persalinus TaxID=266149 RepID=A0A0V0Q857_PSEPJ|nr:hypothetical protein PPERSA_11264 [Pseudocohnilembus persalinus]|eukprot:KRW98418.1 hypothetical protein PPERSA_11264 [Pseudocohnilembus persalinus]
MNQDSSEIYKNNEDQYIQSIINWMKNDKLNLQHPPQNIQDLYSGTIFFDLLVNAEPSKFNDHRIIRDQVDYQSINKNLGELLEQLYNFYSDQEFLKPFTYAFVDTKNIAYQNEKSKLETLKLAELVIGALVFSSQNQIFVSAIQDLDITGQEYIAKIIELRSANDDIDQSPTQSNDNNQNYNLLEKLDEKEIEIQNAISRIQQLETKLSEYEAINKGLNETIEEKDKQVQELNEKIVNFDTESQSINPQAEKFEEYTKKNDKYTEQGQNLAQANKKLVEYEKEIKNLQTKLETQKQQIQSGNIDYILEIQKKDEQLIDKSQKIQDLQNQINELQSQPYNISNIKIHSAQEDNDLPKRGNLNLKEELQQEAVNLSFLNPNRSSQLFESQIGGEKYSFDQEELHMKEIINLKDKVKKLQNQVDVYQQKENNSNNNTKNNNNDLSPKVQIKSDQNIVQTEKENIKNLTNNSQSEKLNQDQKSQQISQTPSQNEIFDQQATQKKTKCQSDNNLNSNNNISINTLAKNNKEISHLQDQLDQANLENKKVWQAYLENTFVYEEEIQLMVSAMTEMRLQIQEKQNKLKDIN